MNPILSIYECWLERTKDPTVAATLVLAEVIAESLAKSQHVKKAASGLPNGLPFQMSDSAGVDLRKYGPVQPECVQQDPAAKGELTQYLPIAEERANDLPPPDTPLTVKQAARRLNVDDRTVYALCGSGDLAHVRIGIGRGTIRITPGDLQEYLERNRVENRVEAAVEDHLFGPA